MALLTLFVISIFLSINTYLESERLKDAFAIEKVFLISELSSSKIQDAPLTTSRLREIYTIAALDYVRAKMSLSIARWDNAPDDVVSAAKKSYEQFNSDPIPNAYFSTFRGSHGNARTSCNAAIYRGPSGEKIRVFSVIGKVTIELVPLDSVFLLNFSDECPGHLRSFDSAALAAVDSAVLINVQGDEISWHIGLPERVYDRIIQSDRLELRNNKIVIDRSQFSKNFPGNVAKHVTSEKTAYRIIPIEYIEEIAFSVAQNLTGVLYSPSELDRALSDIYRIYGTKIGWGGVDASSILFVNAAPFVLFCISFLLMNRLSNLPMKPLTTNEPWIFKDCINIFDYVLAHIWALLPVASLFFVYFFFSDINNMGFSFFGIDFYWRSVFGLEPIFQFSYQNEIFGRYFGSFVFVLFFVNSYVIWRIERCLFRMLRCYRYDPNRPNRR